MTTIRRVAPYLWPEGQGWVKRRVVLSLVMLVVAKFVSVSTPFLYKQAVDALAGATPDAGTLLGLTAVGLTVAYGMARLMTTAFQELRDAIFVRVGQRALRKLPEVALTYVEGGADDKMLIHFDSIMGSMTPKERAKPEILTAKRKIRIANGSGTTVQQVNKVLKMHQEMSTAMKKIRKMGGLKGLGALFGKGGIPGMGGGGMGGGGGGLGGLPGG